MVQSEHDLGVDPDCRLLQDALGGNSRTTILVCASQSTQQCHETLSTLRFGSRAKKITNMAKINKELSVEELSRALKAAQETNALQQATIDELRANGGGGDTGQS